MKADDLRPVRYTNKKLFILDQTLLPGREEYIELRTLDQVEEAIKKLKVRGAPAIGVAAAYGVVIALRERVDSCGLLTEAELRKSIDDITCRLASARPTAVNLMKATERMKLAAEAALGDAATYSQPSACSDPAAYAQQPDCSNSVVHAQPSDCSDALLAALFSALENEAETIRREDEEANLAMGEFGLELLKPGMGILTHCNAGALATSCYGTCLSPIYLGNEKGYGFKVFADETRPLLQGARLTSWELDRAGVDVTLICDNMAQTVMRKGWIDAVVVGCDRMAANGDGANKIGTAGLAILAKEFGIPFYMFVPTSTIDLNTPTGDWIEIELRGQDEIKEMWYNVPVAPKGVKAFNPAFDVTPAEYITAVVTERGIVRPPYGPGLRALFEV